MEFEVEDSDFRIQSATSRMQRSRGIGFEKVEWGTLTKHPDP